ncbi:hypothetical protein ACVWXF_001692 [Thermostichus sp. MS-CIW-40]|jgi:hypothetical protein
MTIEHFLLEDALTLHEQMQELDTILKRLARLNGAIG